MKRPPTMEKLPVAELKLKEGNMTWPEYGLEKSCSSSNEGRDNYSLLTRDGSAAGDQEDLVCRNLLEDPLRNLMMAVD